jgi:hypothetical protein
VPLLLLQSKPPRTSAPAFHTHGDGVGRIRRGRRRRRRRREKKEDAAKEK